MGKEAEEVATKDWETKVKVDLSEDTFTMEILLNTRDCVVP